MPWHPTLTYRFTLGPGPAPHARQLAAGLLLQPELGVGGVRVDWGRRTLGVALSSSTAAVAGADGSSTSAAEQQGCPGAEQQDTGAGAQVGLLAVAGT